MTITETPMQVLVVPAIAEALADAIADAVDLTTIEAGRHIPA